MDNQLSLQVQFYRHLVQEWLPKICQYYNLRENYKIELITDKTKMLGAIAFLNYAEKLVRIGVKQTQSLISSTAVSFFVPSITSQLFIKNKDETALFIFIMAHELWHAKQMEDDRLNFYFGDEDKHITFDNFSMSKDEFLALRFSHDIINTTRYNDLPWEIEANDKSIEFINKHYYKHNEDYNDQTASLRDLELSLSHTS